MLSANYPWMVQHKFTQINQEFAAKARTTPNRAQLDTDFRLFLQTNYSETAQDYLAEVGKRLGWMLPIRAAKGQPAQVEPPSVPRKSRKAANAHGMSMTQNPDTGQTSSPVYSQAYTRVQKKPRGRTPAPSPSPAPTPAPKQVSNPLRLRSRLLPGLAKPLSVKATPTSAVATPPPVTPRLFRVTRIESPQELQEKARSFNQKVRRCFVPRTDSGKMLELQLKTVATSDFTRIRDIPKYKLFRVR